MPVERTMVNPKTARMGSSVPALAKAASRASVCLSVMPETPSGRLSPASGQGTMERRAVAPLLSVTETTRKLQLLLLWTPLTEKESLPFASAVAVVLIPRELEPLVMAPLESSFSNVTVYISPAVRACTGGLIRETARRKRPARPEHVPARMVNFMMDSFDICLGCYWALPVALPLLLSPPPPLLW